MNWELKNFGEISRSLPIPFMIGGFFFLHAWQSSQKITIQREIFKVIQEKEELERENEDLKISILTETSVEKLDKLFTQSLQDKKMMQKRSIVTLKLKDKER